MLCSQAKAPLQMPLSFATASTLSLLLGEEETYLKDGYNNPSVFTRDWLQDPHG